MSGASKIEWTGSTWNPVVGCSVVSPGCTNCYAMRQAPRLGRMGQERYAGLTRPSKAGPVWTGEVRLVEDALTIPLRRRKPTTFFVNSMSDLFHESMPDEWIDRVFAVMALADWHTMQVLTKRSARMRAYCNDPQTPDRVDAAMNEIAPAHWCKRELEDAGGWPLPNVWLGVSAEDQHRADERVPDLLATPVAVRFVSAEPLLGPIDFSRLQHSDADDRQWSSDGLAGGAWERIGRSQTYRQMYTGACLDWIIVGSESGPGARPCDLAWVRSIRDQCEAAKVAFFWKQHAERGRKIPTPELDGRRWVELPL